MATLEPNMWPRPFDIGAYELFCRCRAILRATDPIWSVPMKGNGGRRGGTARTVDRGLSTADVALLRARKLTTAALCRAYLFRRPARRRENKVNLGAEERRVRALCERVAQWPTAAAILEGRKPNRNPCLDAPRHVVAAGRRKDGWWNG